VTGNPVFDDNGEISLVVVNERDITNLNKLRNDLAETKALASRYRSELSLMDKQTSLLSEAVIRSEIMHTVLNRSMKVAQVDSTILIQGETGVGKGFFARLIHRASPAMKALSSVWIVAPFQKPLLNQSYSDMKKERSRVLELRGNPAFLN